MFIFSMLLLSACCAKPNNCNCGCNCQCHSHHHGGNCGCNNGCRRGCTCTRCQQRVDCTKYTFYEDGYPVDMLTVRNNRSDGCSSFGSYSPLNSCNSEEFYNRQYGLYR